MSTATIDHHPSHSPEQEAPLPELPRAIGEHAVKETEFEHKSVEEQTETVRSRIADAKSLLDEFAESQSVDRRADIRRIFATELAEPLYRLYKDHLQENPRSEDFLSLVCDTPEQRALASYHIKNEIALESLQHYLDSHHIDHRRPTYNQIGSGVNIVIEDFPINHTVATSRTSEYGPQPSHSVRSRDVSHPFRDQNLPLRNPLVILENSETHENSVTMVRKLKARLEKKRIADQEKAERKAAARTRKRLAHQQRVAEQRRERRATKIAKDRAKQPLPMPTALSATSSLYNGYVIANLPSIGHVFTHEQSEPPYEFSRDAKSNVAESYALRIIDEVVGDEPIDGDKLTAAQVADRISQSIDIDGDTPDIIELKRLAATICTGKGMDTRAVIQIIDVLGGRYGMRTSELKDFIVYMYEWSHADAVGVENMLTGSLNNLNGFRLEVSTAKLLRAAGYEVTYATQKEDYGGIDLFVDGIPFDVKASKSTLRYYLKHSNNSRKNRSVKLVPPFTVKDFDGELILPDKSVEQILSNPDVVAMIDDAIAQYIKLHPAEYAQNEPDASPSADEQRAQSTERETNTQAELEIAKLARNATLLHRRRVKKVADAKWAA